jgi:hypothetical protein
MVISMQTCPVALVGAVAVPAISSVRRRLYGLCVVVALAVLVVLRLTGESLTLVNVYMPLVAATILAVGLAGAEWHLHVQEAAAVRERQRAEQAAAERVALARQQTFNRLWQELAESRGAALLPATVFAELADLFGAACVAVWRADLDRTGFHLYGSHPSTREELIRLEKIGEASPCFDLLRDWKRQVRLADFPVRTSRALVAHCEAHRFQEAVLVPVLVRHDLVGILAFFYQDRPQFTSLVREEMLAAANLFLCAL